MGNAIAVDAGADEQLVVGRGQTIQLADAAYIDIEKSVIIDIHNGDARRPCAVVWYLGFVGDVFEMQVAGIEVKLVLALVSCKEQIDAAVIIEIAGANP